MTSKTPRPRSTGRVTLADVAALAGVSAMTVSRALRGERVVAVPLIEKIRQAADQLGYVPDPAARALASRQSDHVAVLIPMLSNNLFVDVLEAIQRTLRPAGYQTLIGITHYDPKEEEQLLRELLQHRPAGVLVTGMDLTLTSSQLIARTGIPCVHMMELSEQPGVYCVGFSQRQAAIELTEHLIARGRNRIVFAAAQLDPRTLQRLEGWRQAMRAHGLHKAELELLKTQPSSMALGGFMFEQVLRDLPQADAVFFCNDDLAQGALLAAWRLDVKVPDRLAIAGFNDLTGSDLMHPALTTIRTPRTEIGQSAAHMLLQLMRKQEVTEQHVDVGYKLIVRQSS